MSTLKIDDDYHLYYELYQGRPDHPWLIFLHEGLGSVAQWRNFPEQLCRKTSCPGLVYDRIGHGRSTSLRSKRTIHYLHEAALWELPRVLSALIPDHPFILIGHSDGGSISLILGAEQPANLRGIITEAAHVFVEPVTLEGIRGAADTFSRETQTKLHQHHGDKTVDLFTAWSATWLQPWFSFWNIEYLLPAIQVPLLALQGRDDHYGTPAQVEAIVAGTAGRATPIMMEDCGHAPHLEFPELTLDLMSCFVNRIRGLG
ncbi:alpha/beta fold hydrolase [Desulfobulbus alkaliphilus]|uniref:alpha/beta fold hydrolase n=1 Tax=Desulfobulbus alkaliphilus TaxID=869814 RepID=UPI001963A6ED|nr:alpha/beta hydrolase [Desulfobulbus alkaliphilus]MBM9536980.1 alpha/beta fold hydrolase [Desulfobulbus alkaliphilus]